MAGVGTGAVPRVSRMWAGYIDTRRRLDTGKFLVKPPPVFLPGKNPLVERSQPAEQFDNNGVQGNLLGTAAFVVRISGYRRTGIEIDVRPFERQ